MTSCEADFFKILKIAVNPEAEEGQSSPENPISDEPDLQGILSVARRQNLFSLVYDSMGGLRGYEAVEAKYFGKVAASVGRQAQNTADFLELYKNFVAGGLSPIVLKGIICRRLYGNKADFRPSGDEDILVDKPDYQKAVGILNQSGYYTDELPDKNLELVQEVTFKNPENNLTIELHLNPFGCDDDKRAGLNGWFKDVFTSNEVLEIDGVPVRTLPPTDHMLFLIFHAFKHFIHGGFGVRLLLDMLLFARTYYNRINWDYVMQGIKSEGAASFYDDLIYIGNNYLGFDLPVMGETNCPQELLEDMLQMGTFGNLDNNSRTAALFVSDTVRSEGGKANAAKNSKFKKFKRFFRRVFPSWRSWTAHYPYLVDKPWMLPVEWFKRLFRYLRGDSSMGNMEEINKGYHIAERRLELLKKYNIL